MDSNLLITSSAVLLLILLGLSIYNTYKLHQIDDDLNQDLNQESFEQYHDMEIDHNFPMAQPLETSQYIPQKVQQEFPLATPHFLQNPPSVPSHIRKEPISKHPQMNDSIPDPNEMYKRFYS